VNFPYPEILSIKILKIHYESNELKWRKYGPFEEEYLDEKQRINRKEFALIHRIVN
jgi:hypothetical protein